MQRQQSQAGPFRKVQFEIAGLGETHQDVADERGFSRSIQELSTSRLPIAGWFGKLMLRNRGAAC